MPDAGGLLGCLTWLIWLTQVRVETFEDLPIPVADSWEKGVVSTITIVVFSCT